MYRDAPADAADPANGFRISASFGGLLLLVAFFVPALKDCGKDIVPAESLVHNPTSLSDMLGAFAVFGFPYLVPAVFAVSALARRQRLSCGVTLGWIVHYSFAAYVAAVAVGLSYVVIRERQAWVLVPWAVAVVFGVLLARTDRRRAYGFLRGAILMSVALLVWFGFWLSLSGRRYGLWLSSVGAALMLVGTVGEHRTRRGR